LNVLVQGRLRAFSKERLATCTRSHNRRNWRWRSYRDTVTILLTVYFSTKKTAPHYTPGDHHTLGDHFTTLRRELSHEQWKPGLISDLISPFELTQNFTPVQQVKGTNGLVVSATRCYVTKMVSSHGARDTKGLGPRDDSQGLVSLGSVCPNINGRKLHLLRVDIFGCYFCP